MIELAKGHLRLLMQLDQAPISLHQITGPRLLGLQELESLGLAKRILSRMDITELGDEILNQLVTYFDAMMKVKE